MGFSDRKNLKMFVLSSIFTTC